jgi:hypothetical protein
MNFNREVNFVTKTNGRGYWSTIEKTVQINRVALAYVDEDGTFGELRAYFDPTEWDVDNDGLIYTDSAWMSGFRECIKTLGFSDEAVDDISYSEAGMQGDNYVSMDVGSDFIRECSPLYRFAVNKEAINI